MMKLLIEQEQNMLRGIVTSSAFPIFERLAALMKADWDKNPVVVDTEWETIVKTISKEAKKEAIDKFINQLYEEVS